MLNLRMKLPGRDDSKIASVLVIVALLGFLGVMVGLMWWGGAVGSGAGSSGRASGNTIDVTLKPSDDDDDDDDDEALKKKTTSRASSGTTPAPLVKQDTPPIVSSVGHDPAAVPSKIVEEPSVPSGSGSSVQKDRQDAVRKAMQHAWDGYVKYAWGRDELKPVSKTHQNWLDIGLTIIDSLDSLWVMGMKEEFQKARDWVANELSFDKNRDVSTFETSIRVFGGLLSAYDLSRDRIFLDKAKDIGDRLLKAFDGSPLGVPLSQVNLMSGKASLPSWTGGRAILSEVGTLQLEYVYLAKQLNEPKYAERALDIFDLLHKKSQEQKLHGLYPVYVNSNTGQLSGHVTLGALGDSYYEYLLKMWYLTDRKVPRFREMYDEAAGSIAEKMVKQTSPNKLWYFAELGDALQSRTNDKMDELACFAAGGMFGYGAHGSTKERDSKIAEEVTAFCHEMWARMGSGIAPEWVSCSSKESDFQPGSGGSHYLLRPETIETYFYQWRLTHNPKYRDWAWEAFQAIEKSCKVESGGYSGIRDVTNPNGGAKDDLQQSFFLAETLKYFYLIFSDDNLCSLKDIVFGTEAHPYSIFKEPVKEWGHLFEKFDKRVWESEKK